MNNAPSNTQIAKTSFYIGLIGYGGPAIIAQMKKALVKQTQWVKEDEFMDILSLARILPGATGVSLMGYWGFKFKGVIGWGNILGALYLTRIPFHYNSCSIIFPI